MRQAMVWAMVKTAADVHGGALVSKAAEDVTARRTGNGTGSHDRNSPRTSPDGGEFFDDSAPDAPRPEQRFFDDPALDRLMGVVWALATEVYVLRDRQHVLEEALARSGMIDRDALDTEADPQELMDKAADRDAFVAHLMDNLMGIQAAKGPVR
jgi:hypothetical protein